MENTSLAQNMNIRPISRKQDSATDEVLHCTQELQLSAIFYENLSYLIFVRPKNNSFCDIKMFYGNCFKNSVKDTWRAFSATDHVETSSNDMWSLATSSQTFVDGHFEEIVSDVNAVLVQFQLRADLLDVTFTWRRTKQLCILRGIKGKKVQFLCCVDGTSRLGPDVSI